MPTHSPLPPTPPSDEFVQLFTRSQRKLYLGILAQVPRPDDAEEILQNTNVVIWSKCDRFEPGTNFLAWARQISSFEVMKFRQKFARDKLQFSDEFVNRIAAAMEADTDLIDRRRRALALCLGKLSEDDGNLIRRRYAPGENGKSVAAALQRPANSVYQSLGRIRRALLDCIERQLRLAEVT